MKELVQRLMKHRTRFLIVVLLRAVSSVATLLLPFIMSSIVNNGISSGDMGYIGSRCLMMLGAALVALLSAVLTTFLNSGITAEFTAEIQKDLFGKIMGMKFEDYTGFGTSSLITRCNEDVFTLQEVIAQVTYVFVSFPVLFFGGVILTMMKDVKVGCVMLIVSPLVLLIVRLITKNMGRLWENSDKYIDIQNKLVRERLSGIRVIRAFDKEEFEHGRIASATKEMAQNIIHANVLSGTLRPICSILLNLVMVGMLYVGAKDMTEGGLITAGDIAASVQYIALVLNGLMILCWAIAFMPHLKVSLRRINEVLQVENTKTEESEGIITDGSFCMEHVTFHYPGAEDATLTDVSLEAKSGETIAIIGGTGSGKSTLIKLLMRFYPIEEGKMTLGERDYETISRETIRDNFAVALQKSMIFEGSIENNLRFGKADATEEEMLKACEIAQIKSFVESQREGLSYALTQAGANISGGQKQRINIARTILKDAAIYVFDDSFSALDYLTESNLRKALNQHLAGKTQIIITQRAATAMRCDRIYVLDDGVIVGSGKHKELLNNCKIYKEIYDSQLGGDANAS